MVFCKRPIPSSQKCLDGARGRGEGAPGARGSALHPANQASPLSRLPTPASFICPQEGQGLHPQVPGKSSSLPSLEFQALSSGAVPATGSFISENASAPLPSACWEFAGSSVPRPPALRLPAVPRSRACQGLPCHPLSNRDRPPPSSHFFPTSSDLLVLSPPPSPPSPSLPALCCALRLFAHLKSFPPSAS